MQNNQTEIELTQSEQYGVIVSVKNQELADKFDDFITDNYYLFYNLKFEETSTKFYFGQVASRKKVNELVMRFTNS